MVVLPSEDSVNKRGVSNAEHGVDRDCASDCVADCALCPSPRPSPLGRGRIVRCLSIKTAAESGQPPSANHQADVYHSLPLNPPLERDWSPVAAAPTACSCRNPPQVADCVRTRCAPGRRALRTPAGSGAQGAIKVRGILSWGERGRVKAGPLPRPTTLRFGRRLPRWPPTDS